MKFCEGVRECVWDSFFGDCCSCGEKDCLDVNGIVHELYLYKY